MSRPEDEDSTVPVLAEEIVAGRAALAAGDHVEALMRAARAVSVAPYDVNACAFADQIIDAVDDAVGPLQGDDVSFGTVTLRARVTAHHGDLITAGILALQVRR